MPPKSATATKAKKPEAISVNKDIVVLMDIVPKVDEDKKVKAKPSKAKAKIDEAPPAPPAPEALPATADISTIRRGRRRKLEFSDKINNDEYIAMWEHVMDNEKYLIDTAGNVYTFDVAHPKLIGKQTLDNKIELLNP